MTWNKIENPYKKPREPKIFTNIERMEFGIIDVPDLIIYTDKASGKKYELEATRETVFTVSGEDITLDEVSKFFDDEFEIPN